MSRHLAVLLVSLLVMPLAPARADPPVEAAERLAQLRNRHQRLSGELDGAEARLSRAARVAGETAVRLQDAREQHIEIVEELAEARAELRHHEDRLAERVRRLYMDGEQASLVLLLSIQRVEDLDAGLEYLLSTAQVGAGLLDGLREARAAVERLETEAARVVDEAQSEAERAEVAYHAARGETESLRQELAVLSLRLENLEAAWSDHRLELARQVVAEVAPAKPLEEATLAQARLRASLPLGPAEGIPPGWRSGGLLLEGVASWYGPGFHGRRTASGAIYDQRDFTIAHKTLPHETVLLVTYRDRQVVVMVNDRGPYVEGREFDLSWAAAQHLGLGVGRVTAEVILKG